MTGLAQLEREEFAAIKPLFEPLLHHPMCASVVAGAYPGDIFVDSASAPRAALLTTFISSEEGGIWAFLAGDPTNDSFNQALNRALFEREIIAANAPTVWFTTHPDGWQQAMSLICSPREPITIRRRRYVASKAAPDSVVTMPEGFTIAALNDELFHKDVQISSQVDSILSRWRSLQNLHDYGFATISSEAPGQPAQIASFTTVDFVVDGLAEIGVFTSEAYRQRGLATVSTTAAMDKGPKMGVNQFNWSCVDDNIASIKLAEKLGYKRKDDYEIVLLIFDEAMNLAESAYRHLLAGDYQEVIKRYEAFFQLRQEPPLWAYLDNARAWAGAGDESQAFRYINQAIDNGLRDWDELESYPELQRLHSLDAWKETLDRMEASSSDV